MKVHCASNNEKGGHTHDAQSKLSKNQKKICFRIAVIQTLSGVSLSFEVEGFSW